MIEALQKFVQPISLLFGLLHVRLESGSQLRVLRCVDHLGQRLEDLLLSALKRFELVNIKLFEGLKFHLEERCFRLLESLTGLVQIFPTRKIILAI